MCLFSFAALQGMTTGDDTIREILSHLEDLTHYSSLFTFVCVLSDFYLKKKVSLNYRDCAMKLHGYISVSYLKDTSLIYLPNMQMGSIYVSFGELPAW